MLSAPTRERSTGERCDLPERTAILSVLRTADQLQIRFARLFRRFGLTPQQYNILRILRDARQPLPILDIAARMITVVPGITGLIDRLEVANLVERKRCEADRRVVYVAISPAALDVLAQLDLPLEDLHRSLLGHMSPEELDELNHLLEKARERLTAVPPVACSLSPVSCPLTPAAMLTIRKSADRGHFNHGWLATHHTFSFSDYYDPKWMGFRTLRVMNEDRIAPGGGFGMHPHRDMEIVTCVLSGALEHKDNLGHGEVLKPGEFQRMTAGTGIRHSEFNPSLTHEVHLYQIWLLPRQQGLAPGYEQKRFDPAGRTNQWQLVASPDGAAGSLTIQQDAKIYLADLSERQSVPFDLAPGRHAWLQVLRGGVELNARPLAMGDGVAISEETLLSVKAPSSAELMLFDLS